MTRISALIIFVLNISAFSAVVRAQTERLFLGLKLSPEVRAFADDVERKTGNRIYAEFAVFDDQYLLGASFISENGEAIVRVNANLKSQKRKLEAVIAHELLHLRLRADGFPVFLFSPTVKTRRGLAQEVEQPNANDLASLIEHRIFKAEMDKLGLNQIVDLAGDTERSAARRAGEADDQADALNYARALLEYQKPADVENLRKIYVRNKWRKSLTIGQQIADLIARSNVDSPASSARVFELCLAKLYPSPRPLKLTPDKSVKTYRQLLISF